MTAKRFKAAFFVLAAAALVALLAGCDGLFGGSSDNTGAESGTGSAGGQADYAGVGYGPYTASGPYGGSITVEGVPEGIRITKVDPPQADTMVCVWEEGTGSDGAVYESYHRVFYPGGFSGPEGISWPEISTNYENDFIYKFTRKDVVYGVLLVAWTPGLDGGWVEVQSDIAYVRAGGGIGDLRTIIYDSGYDREQGRLWFDVKEERPAGLPAGGEFWYTLTITPEKWPEYSNVSIGYPWQKWGSAKTEITSIPLYSYDEFGQPVGQPIEVSLEEIATVGEPFRVNYNFLYWVSPDEVYQGNIMTAQKKLFNAN